MGQYRDEWKRYNRAIQVLAEAAITVGLMKFRIKAAGLNERTANVHSKNVVALHQCQSSTMTALKPLPWFLSRGGSGSESAGMGA
jgi:hypothetical protein